MSRDIFKDTMINMTWPQIDRLAKEDALVILPIGVIEEHGYHLPLGTDIYLAASQAMDIADVMTEENYPCVIAPPYYWGTMEVVTKNFPGSFIAETEHIKGILSDILLSLERAGFRRVLAINAHGDGLHIRAVITAFKEFNQEHDLNARYLTFEDDARNFGLTGKENFLLAVPEFPFDKMISGLDQLTDTFDVHAGAIETACMLEAFPQLVDVKLAKEQRPTLLEGDKIEQWKSGKEEYNALTPQGHVGDPANYGALSTKMENANKIIAHQIIEIYQTSL